LAVNEKHKGGILLGVFLDTETNGLDWSKHTILEIAFVIIDMTSGVQLDEYNVMVKVSDAEWERGDKESLAYTKITRESLDTLGKTKDLIKDEMLTLFKKHEINRGKAVFICQNPGFDRSFFRGLVDVATQEKLKLPYYWLDLASMYWVKRFSEKAADYNFPISKDAIADYYGLEGEKKPHRAMQGALHLIKCYNSVVGFPEKDSL
jgi:oligoribonuclease